MKKIVSIFLSLSAVASLSAQTLNIAQGNVSYLLPAAGMGTAQIENGETLTVAGRSFNISEISRIYTSDDQIADNSVEIRWSGNEAFVAIAGNIAPYLSATVDGGNVSIVQSAEVSDTTCGEITYSLSGSSDNGSLTLSGSYKSTLELRGLTLHNPSGAVLDIQNGKRIAISAKSGTVNTLSDGTGGSQKGAIVCKGHLEFKGKGELNVEGHTAHAVYAKEYVEMKNCTLNITAAVKDGINCSQYFLLESGSLSISGTGDDGIQTDFKDSVDREAEDTGTITIGGGKLNISVTAIAAKGLKAEGDVIVSGGECVVSVSGKGKWDSEKQKTKASSCFSADGNFTMTGGVLNLTASGSGGKGVSCDGTLTVDGGEINILTTGGIFAYVNGVEYDGYTGNTDRLASDAKSSPKGMKADTEVVINGGKFNIKTTGNGGEGIESKGILTINDGEIFVNAYDDAINSSSHMYIKSGDITVIANHNDGLDSNGNLYIMGGMIKAFGASSPECGIDAAEEQDYTVIFTGGTLLAVGGGNSVPSNSESTQPYVSGSMQATAGDEVTLKNGDTVLATFTVPAEYTSTSGSTGGGWRPGGMGGRGGSMLITCPGLTNGSSYTMTCGTSSASVTATLKGGSSRPW